MNKKRANFFFILCCVNLKKVLYLHPPEGNILALIYGQGEMAEWSNALVLKTSEGHTSGGSNPSFSAKKPR